MAKPRPTSSLVPAAARGPQALTEAELDLSSTAIDTFVKVLGGRQALIDALAVVSGDADVDHIFGLLVDPRYQDFGIRRLCALGGITVADLFVANRKGGIARAHIKATPIIEANLVGVVEDVMTRAQPYEIACGACGGLGTTPPTGKPDAAPVPCVPCRGGGKLIAMPDLDRQKLALEIGGMTVQKAGLTVNQQTNLIGERASSSAAGALEQMQQAMGELLFSRDRSPQPPTVEAEIVEGPATAAPPT